MPLRSLFFNVFCEDPAVVAIGLGAKPDGTDNDTLRNIRESAEFTLNMVPASLLAAMNVTAIEFPPETSELPDAGLTTAPSGKVSVPRIAESPVALECRMQELIPLGGHTMLLAAVQTIYVRDDCVENEERYYIDTPKLELVGRMHGRGWYAKTTDLVQVSRIRYIDFQASKNAVE